MKQDKRIKKRGEKGGMTTNQKIMICGFTLLIIVIVVAAVFIYKSLNKEEPPAATGNLVIDESNLAEVTDQMAESVKDGMFEVNMNTTWNFPSAKEASADAFVANSNSNHYPISFEILLGDEKEVIYTSTVIPVGNQIKEIKLEKELEPGSYDVVCFYRLWKEDGTENSSFGVNITLNIE